MLYLSAQYALAGSVAIHGKLTLKDGNMPKTVYLHNESENSSDLPGEIKDGRFELQVEVSAATLYNIRLGRSSYDVMLAPATKDISIEASLKNGEVADIRAIPSAETDAYKAFLSMMKLNDGKLEKHFRRCEGPGCEQELHDLLLDYTDDLTDIRKRYPGTYAAEVLCAMRMPVVAQEIKNTTREFRARYFEGVPFSDASVLATPVYHEMIVNYVAFLIEGTLSSEEAFIRDLMQKASADPTIYNHTALSLFDGMLWHSREKMLSMLIRYYDENQRTLTNPVLAVKIGNIRKVMPGNTFTDIVKTDTAGTMHSLKEVVHGSKCTLLLFWSPQCSHCTEEMPQIQMIYDQYHSKGLGIYAYCMDMEAEHWLTYLRAHPLPWTNVIAGSAEQGKATAATDYAVSSTPTIVLIDQKGTILHRFAPKNKLEKYIEDVLK